MSIRTQLIDIFCSHVDCGGMAALAKLNELDDALKVAKKEARFAPTLPEKLERQREARVLEGKRDEAWRAFDEAARDIGAQKDALLDEISKRLEQNVHQEPLFALRWRLT